MNANEAAIVSLRMKGQDLMRSLQKLAENKPVGTIEKNDEPEIRIRKKPKYVRKEIVSHEI